MRGSLSFVKASTPRSSVVLILLLYLASHGGLYRHRNLLIFPQISLCLGSNGGHGHAAQHIRRRDAEEVPQTVTDSKDYELHVEDGDQFDEVRARLDDEARAVQMEAEYLEKRQSTQSDWWWANIKRQGWPAYQNDPNYKVFRNVKDYGAKGQ